MEENKFQPEVCPRCGVVLPASKINMCGAVVDVLRQRPDLTYKQVAEAFHITERTVKRYAKRAGVKRAGVKRLRS